MRRVKMVKDVCSTNVKVSKGEVCWFHNLNFNAGMPYVVLEHEQGYLFLANVEDVQFLDTPKPVSDVLQEASTG